MLPALLNAACSSYATGSARYRSLVRCTDAGGTRAEGGADRREGTGGARRWLDVEFPKR